MRLQSRVDKTYLASKSQSKQHEEEKDRPEGGTRHLGDALWVRDERQTWTCKILIDYIYDIFSHEVSMYLLVSESKQAPV